jgi:hypothetical protein
MLPPLNDCFVWTQSWIAWVRPLPQMSVMVFAPATVPIPLRPRTRIGSRRAPSKRTRTGRAVRKRTSRIPSARTVCSHSALITGAPV